MVIAPSMGSLQIASDPEYVQCGLVAYTHTHLDRLALPHSLPPTFSAQAMGC